MDSGLRELVRPCGPVTPYGALIAARKARAARILLEQIVARNGRNVVSDDSPVSFH